MGKSLGTSRWFDIDQQTIDEFARLTGDLAPIHTDAEWARENSPFGTTIAHGFLSLSMLSAMIYDILYAQNGENYMLNYGFERVRFISPVKVGSRVRGTAKIQGVRTRPDGAIIVSLDFEVEIEGEEKPALVAQWLFLVANPAKG